MLGNLLCFLGVLCSGSKLCRCSWGEFAAAKIALLQDLAISPRRHVIWSVSFTLLAGSHCTSWLSRRKFSAVLQH